MSVGGFLDYMDKTYYHHHRGLLGWVFCDLLDYYYGMPAPALLRQRRSNSGLLAAIFLIGPLVLVKFCRIKWGDPIPDYDESDTTVEEFDTMWEDGEPVETVTEFYDWVDDDTMNPDAATGP